MPQSLAKIILHTVFSTKERRPFLRDESLRAKLHRYIGGILARHDCQSIVVGGVEDHVHFLSTLSRTIEPAQMVKEVKRGSSLWLKTNDPELRDFVWQKRLRHFFHWLFTNSNGARLYHRTGRTS